MGKLKKFFKRFWSAHTSLTAILVLLIVSIFIFYPLSHLYAFRLINAVIFSLILVSGVVLVLRYRVLGIVMSVIIAVAIIINFAKLHSPGPGLLLANTLTSFVCCGLIAVIIMVMVFREKKITFRHIEGAIAVYLLLGLMWAFLYQTVSLLVPGAFVESVSIPELPHIGDRRDFTYFSFVTLTTLGYGDIIPAHPVARVLVILEALIGQLFPAILLAWLVSMQILHRNSK